MKEIHIGLGEFSILQGPNNTEVQMMSYVIKTPAVRETRIICAE